MYRLLLLVLVLGLTVSPIEWPGVLPIGRASVSAIERTLVVASIPYWDQDRAFQSFRDHAAAVDLVSLFWYTLDRRGRLQPYRHAEIDRHIIDFAHRRQVKVLALIANLPDETGRSWDWRRVDRVIATKSQRSRFIGQVVKLVQEHGYDGINLDFEELRESQRPAFSALVRELASALHRKKKLLRVAVEALVDSSHTHGKDWRVIAQHADQMAVMAFNEHWDDSQPGPIASVPWVRRVLSYARLLRLPMQKIHLGIPLYGYDWPQQASGRYGSAEGLEYDQVLARQRQHSVVKRFDARSAAPSFAFEQNGQRHTVRYENHRSLRHKLNLAKEFGVGGVSLWRLGGEDPGIWTSLLKLR
ncbi:MAG: hypothetical protein HY421_00060 [Candidatus Kerfeldbacteria bacterium]|nr:hypothetical protein [Candidatus Kerfeldbacteria bacterium]